MTSVFLNWYHSFPQLVFSVLVIHALLLFPSQLRAEDLLDLGFEDLLEVTVISASKTPTRLMETAAAVSVITREDIERSGACSVPEVLRTVPGLHVAQIDANRWAVTVRGFNGQTANKLLVMIDGRSVYTPTFSGTYWDALDVSLEEIERIEVVRGPGAALWGANAVNGVINIITKSALTDHGSDVTAWLGTHERGGVNLQYTSDHINTGALRVSVKGAVRDQGPLDGTGDDRNTEEGRLSLRWDSQGHNYALQTTASYYQLEQSSTYNQMSFTSPYDRSLTDEADLHGGHFRSRYSHFMDNESQLDVQFYYDYTSRHEWLYDQQIKKINLDIQHNIRLMEAHRVTWGCSADLSWDDYSSRQGQINITPNHRRAHFVSLFAQDDYSMTSDVIMTLGGKCEYNEVTGWEWQPNLRLLWQVNSHLSVWSAVSRAVRTPSHAEQHGDLIIGFEPPSVSIPFVQEITLQGDDDIDSEDLIAWELGSRYAVNDSLSLDLALFHHDYRNLQGGTLQSPLFELVDGQPIVLMTYAANNDFDGFSYGAEFAMDWQVLPAWRLLLAYSFLDMKLKQASSMEVVFPERYSQHQLSIQSRWDVGNDLKVDCWVTYNDGIESQDIDACWELQLRVDWQMAPQWRVELIGQNLLHDEKREFNSELSSMVSSKSERGALLRIHYEF